MPKTPPLILPNNSNHWTSRPKVNKKKPSTGLNIFTAQNTVSKHISFDDTDEIQYIPSYNYASSEISTDTNKDTMELSHTQKYSPISHLHQASHDMQDKHGAKQSSEKEQDEPMDVEEEVLLQQQQQVKSSRENKEKEDDVRSTPTFQTNEQFDAMIVEGLSSEFQKYMEEHRQIKRSIEERKRDLMLYTEERMQYLDQRQSYFQRQLKLLKQYF
ncbi:uncharacterized protein B0P05DRAFT_546318 [Gilbertella persicaria]|uniref:uncharacterized protein n=1 Tax=Gilbertella persicaria TaxID=101096 RepID=UPI0022207F83|nr:uncharacterized protein B0P05DRAFT_546318 [Gilbertella persicaria]KAI8076547.1 hypothetical protein B0P05DRAFT_546318 [Gilbertella persicaria]